MKQISKPQGSVYCNKGAWKQFKTLISNLSPSSIFVLTDANTETACLSYFVEKSGLDHFNTLSVPAGERYKSIQTCVSLWESLSEMGADRQSLLINLGGGVVTDMGGFVACTFQRGISFINIPTSLLAMVDASVGGKTGIDLGSLKNQVGIIRNPLAVIVDTHFLQTLPESELRSGMAEMIKHGFITDDAYLDAAFDFNLGNDDTAANLIWESIEIKDRVISEDPTEKGIRKTLNFGHTLGHAIESHCLESKHMEQRLHGEAIAIGMILATYISHRLFDFPEEKLQTYSKRVHSMYPIVTFAEGDIEEIIKLLIFDKKNSHGKVRFVLLSDVGKAKLNCEVPEPIIWDAFKFYQGLAQE